jgi:hypothetical protein
MKALATILVTILLAATVSYAKNNAVGAETAHYGVGLSQINTGTGHGTGYTINANIMKGRKSLEIGVIYSEHESKFAGGDVKYKVFLGNVQRVQDENKFYKPYLQYNLIYQKGTSYSPDIVTFGDASYEIPTEPSSIATMGHYLAYGNKIKLFGDVYFDSSFGLGVYFGSLDKVNGPDTWGIHGTNAGLTYSIKLGIGYIFN